MVFFLCLYFGKQFMKCCEEALEISNRAKH